MLKTKLECKFNPNAATGDIHLPLEYGFQQKSQPVASPGWDLSIDNFMAHFLK